MVAITKGFVKFKKRNFPNFQHFFVSLEVSDLPIVDTRYLGCPVHPYMDYCLSMEMSLNALTSLNCNIIYFINRNYYNLRRRTLVLFSTVIIEMK